MAEAEFVFIIRDQAEGADREDTEMLPADGDVVAGEFRVVEICFDALRQNAIAANIHDRLFAVDGCFAGPCHRAVRHDDAG